LEITTPGKINAFPGKTLYLTFEEGAMKMTGYKSHAEFMQGGEVQMEATWYKDESRARKSRRRRDVCRPLKRANSRAISLERLGRQVYQARQ
jgi:hypothetical protein